MVRIGMPVKHFGAVPLEHMGSVNCTIAVEAKGRTWGRSEEVTSDAKKQPSTMPGVLSTSEAIPSHQSRRLTDMAGGSLSGGSAALIRALGFLIAESLLPKEYSSSEFATGRRPAAPVTLDITAASSRL